MDIKTMINMALAHENMSKADLAKNLGWSPQKLHQRLITGKFTLEELNMIAQAIGADKAEFHIYFKDGTVI